jgi:6-phosphogluconolactonase
VTRLRDILLGLTLGSILSSPALAGAPLPGRSPSQGELVYFGTRGSGPGQGIFAARLDARTGRLTPLGLVAEVDRPTWLAASPQTSFLYSVSEVANDGRSEPSVISFAVDRATGKLHPVNKVGSGGSEPTHLALDRQSQTLFVANYGDGRVSAIPIRPGGDLAPASSVQADIGSGPSPRQAGPHAHGVFLDPGRRYLLVSDLGADKIFLYRFDAAERKLTPADPPFEAAPAGSGPRHLAFHPNGSFVYLVTELTGQLLGYRWDQHRGRLQLLQTLSIVSPKFSGVSNPAEIVAAPDGRHLYVTNRGEDAIIVYSVDAKTGAVKETQRLASQGRTPWSLSIDPSGHWMLVANTTSNAVAEFRIDARTGRLSATPETLQVPAPDNVVFFQ